MRLWMRVLTVLLLPVIGILAYRVTQTPANQLFAGRYFDGLVPIDGIIASRQTQLAFDWSCTYAVADLGDGAPAMPPTRSDDDRGWDYRFGGPWLPTPSAPPGDSMRDTVETCDEDFPADAARRLRQALDEPGSWYVRDEVGETVFVYSIPRRIVARIRYGD